MLPRKISQSVSAQPDFSVSRRGFLISAAATATGLAIGFKPLSGQAADSAAVNPLAAYLEIAQDGSVTILSSQFDMGQGAYHGIATLVLEELGASWSQVDVRGVTGDLALYGNTAMGGVAQLTGGSTSMVTSWDRYRLAAASAREMLVAAAAAEWGVPASEINVEAGQILHQASGKAAGFGTFAKAAASLPVPTNIALKSPADWTQIGNADLRRYDRVGKTTGQQDFTIDVKLPGMLTAVMIHPPKFGATLTAFDGSKAKALKGVVDVVAIDRGIAIVAQDMWTALKGRDLVTADWDESKAETRSSDEILSEYRILAKQTPQAMARNDGDTAGAMAQADTVIEATYEFPYLAHASMEPLNAVARMSPEGVLEVWGGHQMPGLYQYIASQIAETTPD